MQKIPLALARPGMLLAQPVSTATGMTIIGRGCEITEPLLARLKAMDIDWLLVEEIEASHQDAGHSIWSARAARLDHLFRKHADDAWMAEVKESLRCYFLLRHAASAACPPAEGQEPARGTPEP